MVAKLVLDQLEKTGGALTALTLPVANATASQYLQNNGSGVMSWSTVTAASTNVQRATGDVTIGTTAGYDIDGTTEIVVACNAGAANRTITLPAVGAAGAATCIITVVADADATSTYKLTVLESDGLTEVWTGYQKCDFVRLIVSNSAWLVVDHKETYYTRRYLTSNQTVTSTATSKLAATTNITEIGGLWDAAGDKIVVPTGMSGWLDLSMTMSAQDSYYSGGPALYMDGVGFIQYQMGGTGSEGSRQNNGNLAMRVPVTSAQYLEFYIWNYQNASKISAGGSALQTQFAVTFTRTY
tara:strand:+ start:186 stop:1079 length:894 start_codon:yes stop_codon:yes gene_type:complete